MEIPFIRTKNTVSKCGIKIYTKLHTHDIPYLLYILETPYTKNSDMQCIVI